MTDKDMTLASKIASAIMMSGDRRKGVHNIRLCCAERCVGGWAMGPLIDLIENVIRKHERHQRTGKCRTLSRKK